MKHSCAVVGCGDDHIQHYPLETILYRGRIQRAAMYPLPGKIGGDIALCGEHHDWFVAARAQYEAGTPKERDAIWSANPLPWANLFPEGRDIFYEGDDRAGFKKEIKERFGFTPKLNHYGEFHCPAGFLDFIYTQYLMGS